MTRRRIGATFAMAVLAAAASAATPAPTPAPVTLQVGVYQAPPFSMKKPNGEWYGLTVDLWKELAADMNMPYRLVEAAPDAILDGIGNGRYATSAGPFAVTLEREREVDFSHGYTLSGVSIAVLNMRPEDRWLAVVEALSTPTALRLYAGVVVLVLLAGISMWLLERRRNAMFAGRPAQGIGSGIWWAGVTTVSVGYGDKVPITFWGRTVALFWMFVSLVQSNADEHSLVASLDPGLVPTGTQDVDGVRWITYDGAQDGRPVWTTRVVVPSGAAQLAITGAAGTNEYRTLAVATQTQPPLPSN